MESRNKIRIVAALAAVASTCAIVVATGSAANAVAHLLRHAFAALSPEGRAIASAIGWSLPYWLPGAAVALALGLGARRRQRDATIEEAQADAPARFGRLG
jgi:hypothetical protein